MYALTAYKYTWHCGPLCENMTSSAKPEVHSISQRRLRSTAPRLTFTENFIKFSRVVFETCERTDKQTDILINGTLSEIIMTNDD